MKKLMILLFFVCTDISATGIPVLDGAGLSQETVSAMEDVAQTLKQVEEYRTQLTQLENQLQNTLAPAAYVWDQATQTMGSLMGVGNTVDGYIQKFSSIDGYLNKFRDVGYYRSSPCFSAKGCSDADIDALYNDLAYGSEVQDDANDALVKNIKLQQDSFKTDANKLKLLQARAQGATGQMEALQYANQLASAEINQLLQLREALVVAQNAEVARAQALSDLEAKQKASGEQLREGMDNMVIKSNQTWQYN
jgi:type IV secretion system protein TrbJ